MSNLTDPEAAHEILRLIDQRQVQILEDLDRLNERIETIIQLHTANREAVGSSASETSTENAGANQMTAQSMPRDEAA